MSEVQEIKVTDVDPKSEINVRRGGVDENVDKIKASIEKHGYWPEMAIVVRPKPDDNPEYKYEHITGQCRLKACIALGLEIIPAFVLEMSDDEAIQRSWLENEARGDLTTSDKAYWTEKIYKKFNGDGYTGKEAIEKAAQYLGVTVATVMGYYTLVALPDSLKEMVDKGTLNQSDAKTIVKTAYDVNHLEDSQQKMVERADFLLSLERDDRKAAIEAMEKLKHGAPLGDLKEHVDQAGTARSHTIKYVVPSEIYNDFIAWGESRGLNEPATIIAHIVTTTLKQ